MHLLSVVGPEDTVLGDMSQTQKDTSCVAPLSGGPQKSQVADTE